jgi:hypothetical protein
MRVQVAMLYGGLVPLLFTSPSVDATAAADTATRVSSTAQRRFPRILQESVCNDTAAVNFINQSLGPSSANDSLYQNVYFDSVIIPTDDDPSGLYNLSVDIGSLADIYLQNQLRLIYFVQDKQYFGHDSEYTVEILAQHYLLTAFWKVEGPPVLVAGLHSEPLQKEPRTRYAVIFWTVEQVNFTTANITQEEIYAVSDSVRQAIETELPYGYANSALTFNAYAVPRFGAKGVTDSSVVVIGDGYLDFVASLGFANVGKDIVHAKLFSHALQFILDLEDAGGDYDFYIENFNNTRSPELDRRSELEADAMAAYALAHDQGRNFDVEMLIEVANATFAIGDCGSDELDHVTPQQRQCATLWGADEGLDMTADPVSVRQFRELFLQNLDLILALDPSACNLTIDSTASNNTSGAGSHRTTLLLAVISATAWSFFLW